MNRKNTSEMKKIISWILFATILCHASFAQVKLPRLIRDSMILQRDSRIRLWGWASPNEKIKINFKKKNFKTSAGSDGKWSLFLPAMKAGGPYTINIDASNHLSL